MLFSPLLQLFLVVYVDDFKMAGPSGNLARGWKLIRDGVTTDEPAPMSHFLGCTSIEGTTVMADTGLTVRTLTYDMESFLVSCVDLYKELAGPAWKLRRAGTPFIDESHAA